MSLEKKIYNRTGYKRPICREGPQYKGISNKIQIFYHNQAHSNVILTYTSPSSDTWMHKTQPDSFQLDPTQTSNAE